MVAPGAQVAAGQAVMELETDKAVVEVPASVSGTVQEIRVKEGDKIKVGQVIFTVDGAEGKTSAGTTSQTAASSPAQVPQEKAPVQVPQDKPAASRPEAPQPSAPSAASSTT